jgi:hypothetical protein
VEHQNTAHSPFYNCHFRYILNSTLKMVINYNMGTRLLAHFPWNDTNRTKVYIKMDTKCKLSFWDYNLRRASINKLQPPPPHSTSKNEKKNYIFSLSFILCIYYFFRTCIQGWQYRKGDFIYKKKVFQVMLSIFIFPLKSFFCWPLKNFFVLIIVIVG